MLPKGSLGDPLDAPWTALGSLRGSVGRSGAPGTLFGAPRELCGAARELFGALGSDFGALGEDVGSILG